MAKASASRKVSTTFGGAAAVWAGRRNEWDRAMAAPSHARADACREASSDIEDYSRMVRAAGCATEGWREADEQEARGKRIKGDLRVDDAR